MALLACHRAVMRARAGAVSPALATMRACVLLCVLLAGCLAAAAPARSDLQLGPGSNEDQQPFVEEVVVESSLQVRSAPPTRQGRTEARISLQDGATISKTH